MNDISSIVSAMPQGIPMSGNAPAIGSNANLAAAQKQGQDFEAFFLSQSFESMFSGIDANSLFGGGQAESTYRSMMVQEYSKVAAASGTVGIAAAVTREILQMQQKQQQA